jgi:type II secretory pathway component PulK
MKTLEALPHTKARQRQGRGAAVLVILVLLAVMSAIAIANTHTLHALKQELQLLDQRQKQRLHAGPGG